MKTGIYIPSRTQRELANPASPGGRHAQMIKVAIPLLGNGLQPQAVFAQLRAMYGTDVLDSEIMGVIRWATGKNFTPSTSRYLGNTRPKVTSAVSPASASAAIKTFLHRTSVENMTFGDLEVELWEASPWRPLENWKIDPIMFLAGMFYRGETVNIVTEFSKGVDENGKPKANPHGWGQAMERDDAMRFIRDHGTPQSEAGAWIRLNPINGERLPGAKGWKDENITSFRFALLEIDKVSAGLQLALFTRLPLPVNALLLSGGKSIHAIIRVNAKTPETYRAKVAELLALLKPFGVDQLNKNPSRLSRLPGAQRTIGAQGDGQQRLLYFAPDRVECKPIFGGNL